MPGLLQLLLTHLFVQYLGAAAKYQELVIPEDGAEKQNR